MNVFSMLHAVYYTFSGWQGQLTFKRHIIYFSWISISKVATMLKWKIKKKMKLLQLTGFQSTACYIALIIIHELPIQVEP